MSRRKAKNISYKDFLTSSNPDDIDVISKESEIPEFQRNYVWKPAHIEELILSIKDNSIKYYLGNIVIVKDGGGNGIGKIVDGQQRLITLWKLE